MSAFIRKSFSLQDKKNRMVFCLTMRVILYVSANPDLSLFCMQFWTCPQTAKTANLVVDQGADFVGFVHDLVDLGGVVFLCPCAEIFGDLKDRFKYVRQ